MIHFLIIFKLGVKSTLCKIITFRMKDTLFSASRKKKNRAGYQNVWYYIRPAGGAVPMAAMPFYL